MKLFITGGTGFFGRALLNYLINNYSSLDNLKVTLFSRNPHFFLVNYPNYAKLKWLNFIKGDVAEYASFPASAEYSHIIHAATDTTAKEGFTYLDQYNQIIDGTNNVLRFASRSGVKRFLFTSSGAVYGPQTCGSTGFDEASSFIPDTSNPANVYGVSKRIAEHLCALYADAYGIEVMIARCFAFVGEDLPLNAHFAIGNFIRDALFKPQIIVNGNGEDVRSYLYQSDLADWLWKILIFAKSGAIYNVGSDSSINIASLASLVRNILSPEKEIVFNSAPSNNGGRRVYIPNIKRIKNDLSIKINFDLEEAVKLTVKNYKKNNCV